MPEKKTLRLGYVKLADLTADTNREVRARFVPTGDYEQPSVDLSELVVFWVEDVPTHDLPVRLWVRTKLEWQLMLRKNDPKRVVTITAWERISAAVREYNEKNA